MEEDQELEDALDEFAAEIVKMLREREQDV